MSRLRRSSSALLTILAVLGCGDVSETEDEVRLEVLTWWRTTSEEQAFKKLVEPFAQSGVQVRGTDIVAASTTTRAALAPRMLVGKPPSTFQANAGADLLRWLAVESWSGPPDVVENVMSLGPLIEDIGPLLEAEGALSDTYPEVLASVCAASAGKDGFFGVPVNIHRTNWLYFNEARANLDMLGISGWCPSDGSPGTEIPRIAIASRDGFSLTLLAFENILPALAGADLYRGLFQGAPGAGWQTSVSEALTCFRRLAAVFVEVESWDEAVAAVRASGANQPALTVMGDWANVEFGASLGNGVTRIPFPGSETVFVFTADSFPLPSETRYPDETRALLRTFARRETQVPFSLAKGSIPARIMSAEEVGEALGPRAEESRRNFEDSTKVLATSGWFPSYFPGAALDSALYDLTQAAAEDVPAAIAAIIDLLDGSLALLERWQGQLTRCSVGEQ